MNMWEEWSLCGFRIALCGAALSVLASCQTQSGDNNEATASTNQALSTPRQIALSFKLPASSKLDGVVISAATSIAISDRSQVFGDLATNGGTASLGVGDKVGNLFVNGTANIGDRTQVFGNVLARHVVKSASATVSGTIAEVDVAPSTTTISWTASLDGTSLGDVALEPDLSRDLAPGRYQHFTVKSRSTVTLHSGVYEFADFFLDAQARLVIDDSHGPVQVIVDQNFTYRGAIVAGYQPAAQVLFAVLGTTVAIESPFNGLLVAANASVHFQAALPQGHRAFVFGSQVSLEPDTKIAALPFDWTTLGSSFLPKPAPEACLVPVAALQPCPVRGTRTGFVLPGGVSPEDVALASSGVLSVGSGAQANADLVNVGHWETTLGTSAVTGGIWSEAATQLGNSTHVAGNVLSHSTVSNGSQVQVSGTIVQNTPLSPTVPVLWLALFPTTNLGPVSVAAGTTTNLAPGDYGAVNVAAGATLSLRGGTYTFDSLSSAATAVISTAAKDTPVIVHVRSGLALGGRVSRTTDSNQGVLFTYQGKGAIALKQPFQGTLAAPFASLQIAATIGPYRGAFFANNVALDPGAVVLHDAFGSWADLPALEDARRGPLPVIQTRTSNGAPPALDATPQSATQFVNWLVGSTKADLPAARGALQQAGPKETIAANLTQQFSALRATDATRATLILNAVGYLRTQAGETLFTSLLSEPLPTPLDATLEAAQKLRLIERYQTAAVHGLAFMHSSTGDALLKSTMRNHPSLQIRTEAVRSFLFHNPSTDRAALAAQLNPSEASFADRFENRNVDGSSTFDDRLAAYLAKHPQP